MSHHIVPCSLDLEDEGAIDGELHVRAHYEQARAETRLDPAEPEGYEIRRCQLRVDAQLRALVTIVSGISVGFNDAVELALKENEVIARELVDIHNEHLNGQIEEYLLEAHH